MFGCLELLLLIPIVGGKKMLVLTCFQLLIFVNWPKVEVKTIHKDS
jgi:hypothetical protein